MAWYFFNAIGFYRVCPGTNYYTIVSQVIPMETIHLSGGKIFKMTAENLSEQKIYIQKATINGKLLNSPYFSYNEIKEGGELVFHMGPKPNKKWGAQVDFSALNAIDEIK